MEREQILEDIESIQNRVDSMGFKGQNEYNLEVSQQITDYIMNYINWRNQCDIEYSNDVLINDFHEFINDNKKMDTDGLDKSYDTGYKEEIEAIKRRRIENLKRLNAIAKPDKTWFKEAEKRHKEKKYCSFCGKQSCNGNCY